MPTNLTDYFNAKFLDEPLYRWFAFIIVLMAFAVVWNGVLDFIRSE